MLIGTRFRLYPTSAQEHIRCFARKSLQLAGQHAPIDQQYSHFKDEELTPSKLREAWQIENGQGMSLAV